MKTIVCAKHVPDSTIVRFDIRAKSLTNLHYILDPIDEISLSEALKMRDKHGGSVTAISLGTAQAAEALSYCLKMGADDAIHICDEAFADLDAFTTATILAQQIARLSYNLILCGNLSMDEGNGFVGIGIAEALQLPLITSVTRIDVFTDTNTATVHRRLKGGDREIIETSLPAVLTVDSVLTKPVYPRLRTILSGIKKNVKQIDAGSLGLDLSSIEPTSISTGISQPKPRLKKTASIDCSLSPAERMKLIVSGGVSDKCAKAIDKPPHEAAADIIQFMIDNGIISAHQ